MSVCTQTERPPSPPANHHQPSHPHIPPTSQFYPNGDAKSGAGYCSIFVKNVVLAPGVAAVKIEGA